MTRLRNFYRLSRTEKSLWLKAACLVVVLRMTLALLPLKILRDTIAWRWRKGSIVPGPGAPTLRQIIWAAQSAARFVPGATCLVQSLSVLRLAISAGYRVRLKIGTAKEIDGTLKAHAWVEHQGQIVLGAAEENLYTPLLVWTEQGWHAAGSEQS